MRRICKAVAAVVAVLSLLAGCSAKNSAPSPSAQVEGERWASSLSILAQDILNRYPGIGDEQREALKRVVETNRVSVSDYEAGWSRYRQCMIDRGYKEIILVDVGSGIKVETTHVSGTDTQEKKYNEDMSACQTTHSTYIVTLYEMQVGNTSLLRDPYDAVAECLRQAGIVSKSYSGNQFKQETEAYDQAKRSGDNDKWPYSYARENNAAAAVCKATNGMIEVDPSWPREHLW